VLYGNGSVVGYAGANPAYQRAATWGYDIARDLVANPTGGGYYLLDGFGGIHKVGSVPDISGAVYFGWDIARALTLTGAGAGYTLDGWGGLHAFGGAPSVTSTAYWPGWDIARDVDAGPNGVLYVLDGYGGVHQIGGSCHSYHTGFHSYTGFVGSPEGCESSFAGLPYWNTDTARRLEITPDGEGIYVLDKFGEIHRAGSATWLVNRAEAFDFLGNLNNGSIQEAVSAADLYLTADGARLYRVTRDGTATIGEVDQSSIKVSAVLDFEWCQMGEECGDDLENPGWLSSTKDGHWAVWRNETTFDQYLVGLTKQLNNSGHTEVFGSDQAIYIFDDNTALVWASEPGITTVEGCVPPPNPPPGFWEGCDRALDQGAWNTTSNTSIQEYRPLILIHGTTVTGNNTGNPYFLQPPDVRYLTPIRIKPDWQVVSHQVIYGPYDPETPLSDFRMAVELYFAGTPPANPGRLISSPVYDELIDFDLPRLDVAGDPWVVGSWDPRVNNTSSTWRVHGYDRYLGTYEGLSGQACLYATENGQWQVKHCVTYQRGANQKLWRPETMVALPTPVDVPPGEAVVVHFRFDKVPYYIYNPAGYEADGTATLHIEEIPGG
jgi:hypothetical protein